MPQMSFLPWLVALILCVPALLFVLYPFYRPYQRISAEIPDSLDELDGSGDQATLPSQVEDEQAARRALKEVELDYQLGNLDGPDYRSLRERYMRRAFTAHKSILAHEQQLDKLIEERLRHMRNGHEKRVEESHKETMENDDES
jgi:hypothetical protein